jgi:type IV secretion system protein VirB10
VTPSPFVAITPTPVPAQATQDSTQTQTAGKTPAFDPTVDAKRTMDAGARSSSKMALEAAHQIQESDPQTAAQLASFIAKTTGDAASNVGRFAGGGGAQADSMMTRGSSGQAQSNAPSASPSTAFVSTAHPPVDVATLRNDTHEAFVDKEAKAAGDVGYQSTTTGTQLCFGTVVWVELYTDVNSDLPGALRGMVTRPVYDCATHSVVLVPPGAWVDGFYDSRVVFGESRVVAGFTTIEFPGGKLKYVMGSQTGTDPQGASGLPASVDTHSAKAYRSAFSLGILGALSSLLVPQQSAFQQPTITQQLLQQVGTQYVNATTSQVNQQIAQPPTLRLSHGYTFPILITRDLPMRPWVANQ